MQVKEYIAEDQKNKGIVQFMCQNLNDQSCCFYGIFYVKICKNFGINVSLFIQLQEQVININSMTEQQGASELSMASTQKAQPNDQLQQSICRKYSVSIILVLLGFYFLIFAIIQLVTNYSDHTYTASFDCAQLDCVAVFSSLSFPNQTGIYVYLINPKFTQIKLQYFNFDEQTSLTSCSYYIVNKDANMTVSVNGNSLIADDSLYPCSQTAISYPQGTLTVINTDTNASLVLNDEDILAINKPFQNKNISQQWADVSTNHFASWMEDSVSMGLQKYWGYLSSKLPSNLKFTLISRNPIFRSIKDGLALRLSDNSSLSGYNISLCFFNFFWAVGMYVFGCLSFWIVGKKDISEKNLQSHEIQSMKQDQQQQYTLKISS